MIGVEEEEEEEEKEEEEGTRLMVVEKFRLSVVDPPRLTPEVEVEEEDDEDVDVDPLSPFFSFSSSRCNVS